MKKLLFALFMLISVSASAQGFVGKWQAVIDIPGMGEMKVAMIISQDEEGKMAVNLGPSTTVKSVTVTEENMVLTLDAMGTESTCTLTLKDADNMVGVVDAAGFQIDITCTRIKEEQQQ